MINLFIPNKKILILIAGIGLLVVLLTFVSFSSTTQNTLTPSPSIRPSSPSQTNNLPPLPATSAAPFPQIFQSDSVEKNYQRIINKQPLTAAEENAKQLLLAPFEGNSGTIVTTNNFAVEYLRTPRYFMVKILSNDVNAAKESAQAWFSERGISDNGVCNLPVIFYLSEEVSSYLASNNLQFDPSPRGCGQ